MASRTQARVVTYGFAPDAMVRAEGVESAGPDGMRFSLLADGERRPVSIPTLGRLAVHNALAGAAVGLAAGIPAERVAAALAAGWSAPHRGALVRAGGVTIVDNSYNASPASVLAALDLLAGMPGRRIAVLGEMLELGDGAEAGHERVGVAAAATVALLVVVGAGATGIARGARDAGLAVEHIVEVPDRDAAATALGERLANGDVVLVKASRGIALDLLVDDLRARLEAGARLTVELIQGLLLAFAIVVILMPPYIRLLRATGFTKQIRVEGPDSHLVKHGTPTMGGALLIAVVVALYLLLGRPPEGGIYAPLAALAGVGLLGAFDDYLNAKTGEGIRVRQKLIWQVVFAFVAAFLIQRVYGIDQIAVPFYGPVFVDPAVYVAFGAFAIIAASNGVNITDGLDGLAGGTLVFAFVAFLLVALLNDPSSRTSRSSAP